MTGINVEWALGQLDDFIRSTTVHHVPPPSGVISAGSYRTTDSEAEVVKRAQVAEQILDRVLPDWRSLEVSTSRKKRALHHEASLRAQEYLRRQEESGKTFKSVQRGARMFAEGVFAGIRNPLAHEAGQEMPEQEALEYLAALSVLARWVDESTLEVAS